MVDSATQMNKDMQPAVEPLEGQQDEKEQYNEIDQINNELENRERAPMNQAEEIPMFNDFKPSSQTANWM